VIDRMRFTAQKCRIKDIVCGKYVSSVGVGCGYVLLEDGREVSSVHLLGTVVNSYVSDDGKYGFVVLDDGTGMIRVKVFQDTGAIRKVKKGDIVDVVGRLRQYNDEVHIFPEFVKMVDDPNYETLRKIEFALMDFEQGAKRDVIRSLAKEHKDVSEMEESLSEKDIKGDDVSKVIAAEKVREEKDDERGAEVDMKVAKNLIVKSVEEMDEGDGVEYTRIVEKVGLPEAISESAIDELLAEGSCYEPRAGRIKAL